MWKMLSYPVEDTGINWPGCPSYIHGNVVSLAGGSNCNTSLITLFNHFGTHIDAPNHYNPNGPALNEVPFFERFIYDHPLVLDLPKKAGEKILPEDLAPYERQMTECDLLCIRTGFWEIRNQQKDLYNHNGPAVSAAAAKYLMDHFCGQIKAIALDFLSLASPSDTIDGDEAHRYMLGMHHDGYIMIIEDCNLGALPAVIEDGDIRRIYAIPLRFSGVDSGPVTVFAEMN